MKITAQDPNPFSVAELKAHLRIYFSEEDDVIARYSDSSLDFYERLTDHYLRSTTMEQRFAESPVEVFARPFVRLDSAKDDDDEDVSVTVTEAPTGVTVFEWDSDAAGAATLTLEVGETSRGTIPARCSQAIRVLAADAYVYRNFEGDSQMRRSFMSASIFLGEARTTL